MRILVTGATGTTGKLVVERLCSRDGCEVRAAVRSLEKAQRVLPNAAQRVVMDYRAPETVAAAMQGVDALYLLTPGGSEQVEQVWVAIDAAFNQSEVDATHIKLADTSLEGVAPFEAFLPVLKMMRPGVTITPVEVR